MKYIENICMGCDHYCYNNDDRLEEGCRAFPDGIDSHDVGDFHTHDKPLDYQENDFVYTPSKKKFSRSGREIVIYQDSNPYADENGRYKPN